MPLMKKPPSEYMRSEQVYYSFEPDEHTLNFVMEYVGEDKKEDELVEKLLNRSIIKVFDQYFSLNSLQKVVEYFNSGWGVEVSDQMASQDYLEGIKEIPGLKEAIKTLAISESPELMASATEFVLEGLHLHQKLNKEMEGGRVTYGK